jgi:hypothetical protein
MVHTSTFGENSLALRAGLATLETLEREHLGERALAAGDYLRTRLRETLSGYEMVREVRGLGLLNGIEFQPPRKLAMTIRLVIIAILGAFRGHGGSQSLTEPAVNPVIDRGYRQMYNLDFDEAHKLSRNGNASIPATRSGRFPTPPRICSPNSTG